jgi:general secretion pathway protein I
MKARDFFRRRGGFTLIEVLVSLAIFALAAVVLGATYVNVLLNYRTAGRRLGDDQNVRLVRALVIGEPDRTVVAAGGDLPLPDNGTVHWEAKVEEAEVADLFKVSLHCETRTNDGADVPPHDETFILLRPTWSDPAIRDQLRQTATERLAKRNNP